MKPALIAAIVLAFAIHLSPRRNAKEHRPGIAYKAQENDPLTFTPPVNGQQGQNNNQAAQSYSPNGDESAQWVLIIVTTITAGFIGWQAWETSRSAESAARSAKIMERQVTATENSIRLQAAAMRQWLEVQGWRLRGAGAIMELESDSLVIDFEIANPTAYPLTLESYRIVADAVASEVQPVVLLPPKKAYTVSWPVRVDTRDRISNFMRDTLVCTVSVSVTFVDVLQDRHRQDFRQTCVLGRSNASFPQAEASPRRPEDDGPD